MSKSDKNNENKKNNNNSNNNNSPKKTQSKINKQKLISKSVDAKEDFNFYFQIITKKLIKENIKELKFMRF